MIRASIQTDDGALERKFDATAYFENADIYDVVDLARNQWYGEAKDNIADYFRGTDLKEVYDYLENHPQRETNDTVGFVVSLVPFQVLAWLGKNRPEVMEAIQSAENDSPRPLGF